MPESRTASFARMEEMMAALEQLRDGLRDIGLPLAATLAGSAALSVQDEIERFRDMLPLRRSHGA